MKIMIGNKHFEPESEINAERIRFVAPDGHTIFEVAIKDERTIEVRGCDVYKIEGKLFTEQLQIYPHSSNVVRIKTVQYD